MKATKATKAPATWRQQVVFKKPGKYVSADITVIKTGNGNPPVVYENAKPMKVEDIGRNIGHKRVPRDLFGNRLDTLDGQADSIYSRLPVGSELKKLLGNLTRTERRKEIIAIAMKRAS
jgi:hypothetical protein